MDIEKKEYSGALSLPFTDEQFRDFIVSLLGKPQTITKRFEGFYTIDKQTLINLYEIVTQRIFQQNEAKEIQFLTTVYYDDNSSTTLTGFDHLVHYNEKLPLISIAAHLTWQFLVKFKDKNIWEKQEINLSIITTTDNDVQIDIDDSAYGMHDNYIVFKVKHTARSFGADIEAMFSKQLERIVKKPSKFLNLITFNFDERPRIVFLILMTISFFGAMISTIGKDFSTIPLFAEHSYNLLFLILGTSLFAILISYILGNLYIFRAPSFLLLTPSAESDMKKRNNKYRRHYITYVTTLILSIITGIISNYIFYKMIS